MKKPELLAPAGSFERAKIAFLYGADAVYAGTADLSLRTRVNIGNDDFIKIVELAKKNGKRVYTALNIYAFDSDYEKVKTQAKILNDMGVDGVIVSDGGVLDTVKEYAPNVDIHISTQANTVSLETSKFWYRNGAKRIILARELSREKIKFMIQNRPKDLEFEMFIHGAVCVGYSGRCILSNYLTGRASNQGDCAQPCRWEYNLYAEEKETGTLMPIQEDGRGTYLLSAKDLCLINRIPEIIELGVDSLKIEGRLKTEYYLATVVNAYRNAIDEYVDDKESWKPEKYQIELDKAMSRKYSELFYDREDNKEIQNYDDDGRSSVPFLYSGKVLSKGNDLSVVEVRNSIKLGDMLEIIVPGVILPHEFEVKELYDYDSKQKIDIVKPGKAEQKVLMKLPKIAEDNFIIRGKK